MLTCLSNNVGEEKGMEYSALPPIFTIEQAAGYLQVSVGKLRAELESGRIPGLKIAGQWRIKRRALDRLLDSTGGVDKKTEPVAGFLDTNHENAQAAAVSAQAELKTHRDSTAVETDYLKNDLSPPQSTSSARTVPSLGRFGARVFAYHPTKEIGYARLPDNRLVWLKSHHLVHRDAALFPGDTVEFDLEHSEKGLEGRDIRIISQSDEHPVSEPVKPEVVPPAMDYQPKPASLLSAPSQDGPPAAKATIPPGGTPKSQRLYQEAALARAEDRIEEARQLFRQAIEAGGGTQVYEAFFKMETEGRSRAEARRILQRAIETFPDHVNFYAMHGHMERRDRHYQQAEKIFRQSLDRYPRAVNLRWGLGQTLVQIGTEGSLQEAGKLFDSLEREGKLNKHDGLYQRFKVLQRNPRANKAYEFFQSARIRVGIASQRNLPRGITDIVVDIHNTTFDEAFGLDGSFLVRCFQNKPRQNDLRNLTRFLDELGPQEHLGLQDGREVVLNPSLAFIAVPKRGAVRDQVMSILSDNREAIVPLDDALFQKSEDLLRTIHDLLGQYLGQRDLYSSTLPVSGRRFFGRERLLLQLTDGVHRGQFLGIYGLRKIGKTSLIHQLRDEKLRGDAVAYVDLQASAALTTRNCNPLYWELERDLYRRLRGGAQKIADLLRLGRAERFSDLPENGGQASLLFAEDVRAFLDVLGTGKVSGIKRLVIVLDELERILPMAGQAGINGYTEFFGLLRGLAQTERYRGLLSSVVVAANAAISERGYWEGRENPVFALYQPVFLPPLPQDECVEMIRNLGKGMSVYWDEDATSAVFTETGGHPFLARTLCSHIAKQHPQRPLQVTAQMVQAQIGPFIRSESDKLEQITELLRTNFPEEETFLQQSALEETLPEMPDEALRHLLGYHLIAAEGGGYRVTLNLLRRWLRQRAGVRE